MPYVEVMGNPTDMKAQQKVLEIIEMVTNQLFQRLRYRA
jgi:hypothetical protein